MRQARVPIAITILAALFLFTSLCHAQFTPPPVAGFVNPGTGWTPLTGNVGAAVSFTPPPASIYSCITLVSGVCTSWGPWTGSGGGGGGGTVTSVTFTGDGTVLSSTPSAPVTTSGTLTATLANAGAGTVLGNNTASAAAPTYSSAPVLGVDNTTAGTLQLANSAAAAHTIWASGATTTNTIKGFTVAPTSTDIITCTTASTTCTLTDSGKALTGAGAAVPTGPTSSTTNDVVTFTGTAGQIADSGKVITGAGAAVTSGPTSSTTGDVVDFTGTAGQIADSGVLASQLVTSSSSLTSNSVVLGAGSQGSKTVAGIVTDGTSVLTLGVSGTSVGGVALNNATSGSVTLNPVTGALGTVTASFPANTGTVAELNLAQTFSAATTFSAAGAASTPGLSITGASFVGTGTTSTPQLYINQSGTAPTTWTTTGGTGFGLNLSGTTGNAMDVHAAGGASIWFVAGNGNVFQNGNYFMNSTSSPSPYFSGASNFVGVNSSGGYEWANGASAAGTRDVSLWREKSGWMEVGNTSSAGSQGMVDAVGYSSTGTKFTASGCTSITSTVGGASAGKFTIGGNSCTVVVTINGATGMTANNGWSCRANDETTAAGNTGLYFSTNNATTATLTVPSGAAASDVIDFACMAF